MKHKSAKPVDRRVQRTRDLLRNALIAQLQERGWDVISVQHICDHANVGRSTFYTHFNSKDALLAGGFDDLRKMIRAQLLMHVNEEKPFALLRGLIDHAYENQRLFRALIGRRSGQVVVRKFRELVMDLMYEDAFSGSSSTPADNDARVHFISGAFMQLLTWWLESRNNLSPEEFERLFVQLASSAIKTKLSK